MKNSMINRGLVWVFGLLTCFGLQAQNVPNCSPGGLPEGPNICQKPVFQWEKPQGGYAPTAYEFYLGTNNQFEIINGQLVTDTFLVLTTDLALNAEYQWVVVPVNAAGPAEGCTQFHIFQTNSIADPTAQLTPREFNICQGTEIQVSSYVNLGQGPYGQFEFVWTGEYLGMLDDDSIAHPTFSADFPGDFTFEFTVTDTAGCFGKVTWNGTVREAVQNIQLQGSTAICRGDSLKIFAATDASTISWQHSSDSLTWLELFNQDDFLLDVGNVQNEHFYRAVVQKNGCGDTSVVVKQKVRENPDAPLLSYSSELGLPYVCNDDDTLLVTVTNYPDSLVFDEVVRSNELEVYSPGSHRVIYTAENGCKSQTDFSIEERNRPEALVIPLEKLVVCDGNEAMLKIVSDTSDFTSMLWSTGESGSTIFTTASGNYFVDIINTEGCDRRYEDLEVEFVVNPPAPELDIPNGGEACENDGVEVTVLNYGEDLYWDKIVSQRGTSWTFYESGIHYVTFEFNENCRVDTFFQITINPNPPAPVIETPDGRFFCEGSSVVVGVNSFENTVHWSQNGLLILEDSLELEIDASGRYYAVFTNGFQCKDSSYIDVVERPVPDAAVLIQNGSNLEVETPVDGAVYLWYIDNVFLESTNEPLLSINQSGTYHVVVDLNGCSSNASNPVAATSLGEFEITQWHVFPNPTSGWITVAGLSSDFQVLNLLGQIVYTSESGVKTDRETRLLIKEPGVYIIKGLGRTEKIIVE